MRCLPLQITASFCFSHFRFNQGEFSLCLFLMRRLTSVSVSCFLSHAKALSDALPSQLCMNEVIHSFMQTITIY